MLEARMLVPALLLPLLAAGVQTPPSAPIVVKGHAWAPFISPMGEPFRARSPADDTLARWFRQADRNHDETLTMDEMQADADRFFATLDADHNGEIEPEELVHYEWEVAPDIQVMSKRRPPPGAARANGPKGEAEEDAFPPIRTRRPERDDGLQGAARYALLHIPEPVASADTNFDRGISRIEFRQAAILRFQLLDPSRQGRLTMAELETLRAALLAAGDRRTRKDAVDTRIGNPLPGD
jgi:Ca2+-binding EF-hand superfamily protein